MSLVLLYITTSTEAEARGIAGAVLEEKLAACANIIPGMVSLYRWEDAVEEGSETILILKTRAELAGTLQERVRMLHSYDLPCILTLPVTGGNERFLEWVAAETQG